VFTIISVFWLCSCSTKNSIRVQGIDLQQSESQLIELEGIVSLGSLMLPENVMTIKGPDQSELGEISFQKLKDGTNRIALKIDFASAKKHFPLKKPQLPNGHNLPTFPYDLSVMEIPIFENSKLYLGAQSHGFTMTGFALNLPAFDRIFSKIKHSGIIESKSFHFSNIHGSAGLYIANQKGQNGVYVFAGKTLGSDTQQLSRSPSSENVFHQPQLSPLSRFRLKYLFSRNATLRIK